MSLNVEGRLSQLARHGGTPVRDPRQPWPRWPAPPPAAQENLLRVLHSRRWTLTSPISGEPLYERRFAELFAAYTQSAHCVPVDHGSSALVVALEALGLEYGDRVLVPTLTWTASATAALRAGLVPVLTDVAADTGSIGPDNLDPTIGARAVVAVHWSCAMADIPGIQAVADPLAIAVIEDCAQSHGAQWLGRPAGSMGRIGCFSMQNGKVLTAGEGGAVITSQDELLPVLQELRADSRRYRADQGRPGESELVETAGIQGVNFCMPEFQAAVLCAQLAVLDDQHEVRARNYALLREMLAPVPGVRLLRPRPEQTRMSVYELPFIFDELPGGLNPSQLAATLTAELSVPFYLTDTPLHRSPLLQPWTKPTLGPLIGEFISANRGRQFPNCDFLADHCVVTHHSSLLGGERDMADIARAVQKVVQAYA